MIKDIKPYLEKKLEVFETYTKRKPYFNSNYYIVSNEEKHIANLCSIYWTVKFYKGWHALLFEKNVIAAQQHFYICGRMDEFIFEIGFSEKRNMNVLGIVYGSSDVIHLFTALLSSNKDLIARRWKIKFDVLNKYFVKWFTKINFQTWLMAYFTLGEMEPYYKLIDQFASLPKPDKYLADVSYFKALAIGDISAMEKAIEEIASSKMTAFRQKFDYKDLNKNLDWSAGIFSWDGILYTKFAKIQGYDLKIKSPLVTIAQPLIDAPPLEFYDDVFDFLKIQMPNGIMRTREEIEALGIKIIE